MIYTKEWPLETLKQMEQIIYDHNRYKQIPLPPLQRGNVTTHHGGSFMESGNATYRPMLMSTPPPLSGSTRRYSTTS